MPPPNEAMLTALLAERDWVRRLARGVAGDGARADDLEQESWLAALRHPPRDAGNLRAWFARLVRSKSRDAARSDGRRARREAERGRELDAVGAGVEGEHGGSQRSPAEALARAELVRALVDAVLALREPYKQALVLVYFEGLAPKDAARQLGVPDATLRSHVKRGLELVRSQLDRERGGREEWLAGVVTLAVEDGWRCAPSGPIAATLAVGSAAGTGVMLMKMKVAAACVLLLGLAWWGVSHLETERRRTIASADVPNRIALEREELARLPELQGARAPITEPPVQSPAAIETVGTGAVELELVFARDGRPAPGETVEFVTWDGVWRSQAVDVLTDSAGRARIDGLRPGTVRILALRGGGARVEVAAGETKPVRVEIPRGVAVRGRVVTHDGEPAPGASIVVAFQGTRDAREVLRTDGSGRFELADLGDSRAIGARLAGHAPSYLYELERELDASDSRELELVLRGPGGTVEGRVTDARGSPVVGARVAIGPERPYGVESDRGFSATVMCAASAISGEDGSYRVGGLPTGEQEVLVASASFPMHASSVDVLEVATTKLDVVLQRGGALSGRVLLEDGSPAPNTSIELDPKTLHGARAKSDELGFFRVDELAPGEHALEAGSVELGRRVARVAIHAGEEREVEIVLERGHVLSGRVVDEHGRALVNWRVRVAVAQSRYTGAEYELVRSWPQGWNATTTDAEGRFVLCGLPAVNMRIEAREPDLASGVQPLAVLEPVRPPAEDLVLRVVASTAPASWITGVATDASGATVAGAVLDVVVASEGHGGFMTQAVSDAKTGRFRLGPLPAGTYQIHGSAKGFLHAYLATAIVDGIEERDLGTIALKPAARLVVNLRRKGGGSTSSAKVFFASDSQRELTTRLGDHLESNAIEPGTYRIYVQDGGPIDRTHPREVEVRPGETATVDIELEARSR